jgi:hypothetical protein
LLVTEKLCVLKRAANCHPEWRSSIYPRHTRDRDVLQRQGREPVLDKQAKNIAKPGTFAARVQESGGILLQTCLCGLIEAFAPSHQKAGYEAIVLGVWDIQK